MTEWQVTMTTIHCDATDDDVTIMVYKDWSTACTGYKKYGENMNEKTAKMLQKKSKKLGKTLKCEGPQDFRVIEYQKRLAREENKAV